MEDPSIQGWKQFLTARQEMLSAFDSAREKSKAHEVQVQHGRTAEAEFRKWLSSFLPGKYAVTSGYTVSQGTNASKKLSHFDVIIYDRLESPVLWIEGTSDQSSQGRSLAVPAEHVQCVIEVKSRFNASSIKDAVEHLSELSPLLEAIDEPSERYKKYLPANFQCSILCYELVESDIYSEATFQHLLLGAYMRGFTGATILRAEGKALPATGRVRLLSSKTAIEGSLGRSKQSMLASPLATSMPIGNLHVSALLTWAEPYFSEFAFDLLAMLNGTYRAGFLSSFHGFGSSGWTAQP